LTEYMREIGSAATCIGEGEDQVDGIVECITKHQKCRRED
jgi:hypothetical protein